MSTRIRLFAAVLAALCTAAAHAQRMEKGDICDYGATSIRAEEREWRCSMNTLAPSIGPRVEIRSGVGAPPSPTPNCPRPITGQILVGLPYSDRRGDWVDTALIRNCVARDKAPETLAYNRRIDAEEKARVDARIREEEIGGHRLVLPGDRLLRHARDLQRYAHWCPRISDIFRIESPFKWERFRIVCTVAPGAAPASRTYIAELRERNELYFVREVKGR
jgi:hypothetical protein